MFDMKMRARYLLKGNILKLFAGAFLPLFFLLSSFFSAVIPVVVFLEGPQRVIPYMRKEAAVITAVVLAVLSLLFIMFYFIRSFFNKAVFFSISDPSQCKSNIFYSFSQGIRYIRYRILLRLHKAVWALLFFSPAFITAAFTVLEIMHSGEMIKSIFITLVALAVTLLISGACFYFVVSGRYFLADYLMCISPMQPAGEVISSSVISLKGRLVMLAFHRLCTMPYRILALIPFFAPYYASYSKLLNVMIAEKFYGKRIKERKTAPVVFYVNKRSVFAAL